jgi:Flp pilus assembly protein TadG
VKFCGESMRQVFSVRSMRVGLGSTRKRARQKGSTLVETAFVFMLLLLPALFGIMAFGHALYAYHFVSHASKTAARWSAVNGYYCSSDGTCTYSTGAAASDIQTYAVNLVPAGLNPANVDVSATWPAVSGGPATCTTGVNKTGCTVQVTVSYAYSFIFPLLPVNSATTAPCTKPGWCLSSTSQMVILH